MDEFYLMNLVYTVGCVLFVAVSYQLYELYAKRKLGKYLKRDRVKALKSKLPNCIYEPGVNKLQKRFLMKFAAKQRYGRALGHFSFAGKYRDIQMEDFTCFEYIGDTDYYCETILIYCKVPAGSILNRLKSVTFRRSDSIGEVLYGKLEQYVRKKGGIPPQRERLYRLANSNIQVEFDKNEKPSDWIYCFEHGLAEKLIDIFHDYGINALDCTNNILSISINIGTGSDFNLQNDYLIKNTDKIYSAVEKLHSLVYWQTKR